MLVADMILDFWFVNNLQTVLMSTIREQYHRGRGSMLGKLSDLHTLFLGRRMLNIMIAAAYERHRFARPSTPPSTLRNALLTEMTAIIPTCEATAAGASVRRLALWSIRSPKSPAMVSTAKKERRRR